MRANRRWCFLALLAVPLWSSADARPGADDAAAIRQVVEQVRTAIIDKDRDRFMQLFISEDPARVTWRFVVDDARLARLRATTNPDAGKSRDVAQGNHVRFIESIVTSDKRQEEVFSNVKIDADDELAGVAFDYAYLNDGVKTNWGRERWQLLRTEDGWKIVSVVWSVRDP